MCVLSFVRQNLQWCHAVQRLKVALCRSVAKVVSCRTVAQSHAVLQLKVVACCTAAKNHAVQQLKIIPDSG